MRYISNHFSSSYTIREALEMLYTSHKNVSDDILYKSVYSTFGGSYSIYSASARGVLVRLLQHLKHTYSMKNVLIQAYTCAVIPLSIKLADMNIVYADTDNNGLLDTTIIHNNIDIIICQWVFGMRPDIATIRRMYPKSIIIEDCAHGYDSTFDADYKLISLGREKAISITEGGILISKTPLPQLMDNATLSTIYQYKLLLYPLIYGICKAYYSVFGRYIIALLQRSSVFPKALDSIEIEGRYMPQKRFYTMSTLQKRMLYYALQNEKKRINKRWEVYNMLTESYIKYDNGSKNDVLKVDYPHRWLIKVSSQKAICTALKHYNMDMYEWDGCPISPVKSDYNALQYTIGSCPHAENISITLLKLPLTTPYNMPYDVIWNEINDHT